MVRDLRLAFRMLRRTPWYTLTVVFVLAIGMSLTTVAFAVVDGVLFKRLPFPRAGELYLVRADTSTLPRVQPPPVSGRDPLALLEAVPDLRITIVRSDPRLGDASIDERFFEVVGGSPPAGGFTAADFDWFAETERTRQRIRPVLISYRHWQNEYGGDPSVVGRTVVTTNRAGYVAGIRIAGILPRDFVFPLDIGAPQPTQVAPMRRIDRDSPRREFHVIARVATPADVPALAQGLTAASRALPEAAPSPGHPPAELSQRARFDEVTLIPLSDHLARHERPAFALVFAGAGVLLLLACVNVAGLVGARNVERRRDIAIRRALGAGTWPLTRTLLAEVLLLAAVATALALLTARPLLLWTLDLLPATVMLLKAPALDARVFAAAATLALVTVALVSAWPTHVVRTSPVAPALGAAQSTVTGRTRRSTVPLVTMQVALGFVLLTAGALTVSSLARAWRNDAGFQRERMVLLELFVTHSASARESTEKLESVSHLLQSVAGVDGVALSTINRLFAQRSTAGTNVIPEGWTEPAEGVTSRQVSANFFDVMGLRLVDGRSPSPGEWQDQTAAIVSESAARILWTDRPAVGRVLVRRRGATSQRIPVVAVVADARYAALDEDPRGDIYLPDPIEPGRYGAFFHVRTTERADHRIPTLRRPPVRAGGVGRRRDNARGRRDPRYARPVAARRARRSSTRLASRVAEKSCRRTSRCARSRRIPGPSFNVRAQDAIALIS